MKKTLKTLATWGHLGRFRLQFWVHPSGTWRRNFWYRLGLFLPRRKRYGPTVTFYQWWRFELAVEPPARSMQEKLERNFGVPSGTLSQQGKRP